MCSFHAARLPSVVGHCFKWSGIGLAKVLELGVVYSVESVLDSLHHKIRFHRICLWVYMESLGSVNDMEM
jgi:hypothetical protein